MMRVNRVHIEKQVALLGCLFIAFLSTHCFAGPREQAKRIHDRLTGTPPAAAVLDSMAAKIGSNDGLGAAYEAMDNPAFYNTTLKNLVTPWTNESQTVYAPLNDYTATVIGMIRDGIPFNRVLTGDFIYVAAPGVVDAPYSRNDNAQYEQLEADHVDLSDPANLVQVTQSGLDGNVLPPEDIAGVLTTRAFGEAFLQAGTNRRAWRFIGINYLCRDMEQLSDITRPADRIRQDVSRSPGGDSSIFLNSCVGCHAGMDPLTGAFAYFDFDGETGEWIYTPDTVQEKFLINASTFPLGYVTTDNTWNNYWHAGPNAALGWRDLTSPRQGQGKGVRSLGEEITDSRAFSQCQVEKVFNKVCLRQPLSTDDRAEVKRITDVFEATTYDMKRVFAETALYCKGP
jgi:hypothetical protein